MATYKHIRSSTAHKRPTTSIADGQLAINTNTASPGLFFKDSAGTGIVKVGPVHVGTTAPNSSPAAGGSTGNYLGEQWLDTSVSPVQMKVWNGSAWVGIVADELPVSKLQDGAARQLIQTDAAGTGVEWTSNVDVPGTLDVTSTATFDSIAQHPLGTAGAPTITFTGDNNTGIYSPGADQLALSTNGNGRLFVDASGKVGVNTGTPGSYDSNANNLVVATSGNAGISIIGGTSGVSSLYFGDGTGGSTFSGFIDYLHGNDSMRIGTNQSTRAVIDSSGRLGIGTSTPAYTLVAKGGVATTGIVASIINPVSGGNSKIHFTDDATYNWTAGTVGNAFAITPAEASTSAGTPALYIDSSRRVGIGDTTPDALLSIKGNSDANTTPSIRLKDGSDTREAWITNASGDLSLNVGGDDNVPHGTFKLFEGGTLTYSQEAGERFRCDSSGRLLVGTSSSRSDLSGPPLVQIEGANDNGQRYMSLTYGANAVNGPYIFLAKHRGTTVGGTTVVQSGDQLGALNFYGHDGTDFEEAARIQAFVDGTPSTDDMPGRLVFSTTADGASSPTERMRIGNGGITSMFASAGWSGLSVRLGEGAGTVYTGLRVMHSATSTLTGTEAFKVFSNGNVQNTNNSYTAISDIKLKENIVDANSQWDDIKALQVRNYNLKEGQTHTQIGLIAQEVEPISPGLVYESPDRDEDGNDLGTVTKSVNYSVLYMKAVKALQEAMERIETLEAKVAALESA